MRQFIYKMVVAVLAIILVFEFTIGKKISQFGGKVDAISSKEGRKETVNKLRKEIQKAVKKEASNTYPGCNRKRTSTERVASTLGTIHIILSDRHLIWVKRTEFGQRIPSNLPTYEKINSNFAQSPGWPALHHEHQRDAATSSQVISTGLPVFAPYLADR